MSRWTKVVAAAMLATGIALHPAVAQAPGPQAGTARGGAPTAIEALVAPVALYPDDLLAVVLRAATQPVQIVQAGRFLDKAAQNRNLQPSPNWIEPVKVLLNYPEVLRKMSDDLDWTERLGEAVQARQADVLAAIQQFRRKAAAAGNLRSDDKLSVAQDAGNYVIASVNPQVIYVPVYDPGAVLVPQPAPPPPAYVPTPYPAYYEPYPAGAAAATGFFFGAATTAWAMNWNNYDIDEDDVRDFQQSRQQAAKDMQQSGQSATAQRQQARQDSTAGRQQSRQEAIQGRQPSAQPLGAGQGQQDLRAALGGGRPAQMPAGGGAAARPAIQQQPGYGGGFAERPGYQQQRPAGQGIQQRPQSMDAFSYGSGRDTMQASNRGAQSRNVGGGSRQFSGGGGHGGGGRGGRR